MKLIFALTRVCQDSCPLLCSLYEGTTPLLVFKACQKNCSPILRQDDVIALSTLSIVIWAAPAPQSRTGVNDPDYSWQVTGWTAGCARSGCYYGNTSLILWSSIFTKTCRFQRHWRRIRVKPNNSRVRSIMSRRNRRRTIQVMWCLWQRFRKQSYCGQAAGSWDWNRCTYWSKLTVDRSRTSVSTGLLQLNISKTAETRCLGVLITNLLEMPQQATTNLLLPRSLSQSLRHPRSLLRRCRLQRWHLAESILCSELQLGQW